MTEAHKPIPRDTIVNTTCDVCGVHRPELGTATRHPLVVAARMIITHLLRKHTHMSYPEIARLIGRPNHSTVITAHQRLLTAVVLPAKHPKRRVRIGIGDTLDIVDLLSKSERDVQHRAPGCGLQEVPA